MPLPEVPIVGRILWNLIFECFDRGLQARFPQFPLARYLFMGFVKITFGKAKEFPKNEFEEFVSDLGLVGHLMYIMPGAAPVEFMGNLIFLNERCEVQVFATNGFDS